MAAAQIAEVVGNAVPLQVAAPLGVDIDIKKSEGSFTPRHQRLERAIELRASITDRTVDGDHAVELDAVRAYARQGL